MSDLKLLALDTEDLEVISAHVQDAVLKVEDMGLSESGRRFVLLMNRFDWEEGKGRGVRKRAALQFDFVQSLQISGIDARARDGVLELLTVTFSPSEAPAGVVELSFSGGGTARLEVECLEARLRDLGAAWSAKARPAHILEDEKK